MDLTLRASYGEDLILNGSVLSFDGTASDKHIDLTVRSAGQQHLLQHTNATAPDAPGNQRTVAVLYSSYIV